MQATRREVMTGIGAAGLAPSLGKAASASDDAALVRSRLFFARLPDSGIKPFG